MAKPTLPLKKKPAKTAVKKAQAKRRRVALTSPDNAPADDVRLPTGVGDDFIPGSVLIKYATFVQHYLETGDAPEAAAKAGYVGANAQAQKALGARLLENPYVKQMVAAQYAAILAKTGATVERVWQEITHTAFFDPAEAYDEHGEPLPMDQIPEHVRRAITGYKTTRKTFGEDGEVEERELKFGGKDAALDKLMKLHRMVDNDKLVVLDGEQFIKAMEKGRERAGQR